jgi:hypothetical protein
MAMMPMPIRANLPRAKVLTGGFACDQSAGTQRFSRGERADEARCDALENELREV